MPYGQINLGGVQLTEYTAASSSGMQVSIEGQESHPPSTRAQVRSVHSNFSALTGLVLPVTFTDKPQLSGFYMIDSATSDLVDALGGFYITARWKLGMTRLGSANDVEIESRIPQVGRQNDFGLLPVLWHAPAVGATSYYTGPAVPGARIERVSSDGVVPVYTDPPAGVAPRWTVSADDYLRGSARVVFDTFRRLGVVTPAQAVWELTNGIVRVVSGNAGAIIVQCWDQGQWRSGYEWQFTADGLPLSMAPELSIMRNTFEEVALRLTYPTAVAGRLTVDLSVRRGARFVTAVIKRHSAVTLGIQRVGADGATAPVTGNGWMQRGDVDADGNVWLVGSARTVTKTNTGMTRAPNTLFDLFIGHVVDASAPKTGDGATELMRQYLGSNGESSRVVLL